MYIWLVLTPVHQSTNLLEAISTPPDNPSVSGDLEPHGIVYPNLEAAAILNICSGQGSLWAIKRNFTWLG